MKAVFQVSTYDRGSVRMSEVGRRRCDDERTAEGSRVAHKGRQQGALDIGSLAQGRSSAISGNFLGPALQLGYRT